MRSHEFSSTSSMERTAPPQPVESSASSSTARGQRANMMEPHEKARTPVTFDWVFFKYVMATAMIFYVIINKGIVLQYPFPVCISFIIKVIEH